MSDRARQKKLEKHRKKRAEARSKARASLVPMTGASLERAAEKWPVVGAWLAGDVRDEREAALVTALLAREMPDGRTLVASALVDRTCLGVKDGCLFRPMERDALDEVLDRLEYAHETLVEADPDYVRSIVFHAIDYAATLGFSPHRDFPVRLFEPRPVPLLETPLCRPARPLYVAGPNDDTSSILRRLDAHVGADGYDFVSSFDDPDELAVRPAQQMKDYVEPLLAETDGSLEAMNKVLGMGMAFWNMALADADEGARMLASCLDALPTEPARQQFADVAGVMIERHRAMFPQMHRARGVQTGAPSDAVPGRRSSGSVSEAPVQARPTRGLTVR